MGDLRAERQEEVSRGHSTLKEGRPKSLKQGVVAEQQKEPPQIDVTKLRPKAYQSSSIDDVPG